MGRYTRPSPPPPTDDEWVQMRSDSTYLGEHQAAAAAVPVETPLIQSALQHSVLGIWSLLWGCDSAMSSADRVRKRAPNSPKTTHTNRGRAHFD